MKTSWRTVQIERDNDTSQNKLVGEGRTLERHSLLSSFRAGLGLTCSHFVDPTVTVDSIEWSGFDDG